MNLTPRNKLLLTIAAVVIAVVLLAVLLVLPQINKLGQLAAEQEAAEQAAQNARTLLEQRRDVRNRAAATDAALMQLATAFPENPELTSAIIELQDLAYENEVQIKTITPAELAPRTSHIALPISLQFWADWRETVDFTQQIMSLNRQYRVVELSSRRLLPGDTADQPMKIDLEPYPVLTVLQLEAYIIPAATEASAPAPVAPAPTE